MAERCCCSDDTFATLHPGGLPRTVEIVKRLHLPIGSAILDVGCGEGRSVCALAQMGYHAYGIESSAETLSRSHALEGSEDLQWGNAENLPFADESFTCVLFECSLSEMDIPQALAECSRVLEPGGIAVVHDVYDRGGRTCSNSEHPITAIPSKSKWVAYLHDAGFMNSTFEERSQDLKAMARRLNKSDEALWESLEKSYDAKRTGYMLIISEKPHSMTDSSARTDDSSAELSIGQTTSVCPICLQSIPAEYIRRDEQVYLRKNCTEHGDFETLIWEDATTFQSWDARTRTRKASLVPADASCPSACLTCTSHKTRPCCVVLQLTERCNLGCPICFASAGTDHAVEDPTLDEIDAWFTMLVERAGKVNIQLSGGEPTLRDDLDQIIALGKAHGVTYFQLNTNGLRLAREADFARKLKDAGLSCVFLQFDGMRSSTYLTLRGRDLLDEKRRAIENCAAAHLPVVLVPTIVAGVNDGELGEIVSFGIEHSPTVRGLHIQPVSYFGRIEGIETERITIPGVLAALEEQTGQMVRASDFVGGSAEHSRCSFSANYRIGNDGILTHVGQPAASCCCEPADYGDGQADESVSSAIKEDAVSRAQQIVELRWGTDLEGLDEEKAAPGSLDAYLQEIRSRSFSITGMAFQDAWTLDLDRLQKCYLFVVDKRRVPVPFCAYNITAADGSHLN